MVQLLETKCQHIALFKITLIEVQFCLQFSGSHIETPHGILVLYKNPFVTPQDTQKIASKVQK